MTDLFHRTRSVRNYEKGRLDADTVSRIIEKAGQAPSGLNKQPWLYAVIFNEGIREHIRRECELVESNFYKKIGKKKDEFFEMNISVKKPFLTEASCLVAVFGDTSAPYFRESVWLSVGWFMLAAQDEGLSTLTYTPEEMGFLNELLGIDKLYHPEVILPLGQGAKKGKKTRNEITEIMKLYE